MIDLLFVVLNSALFCFVIVRYGKKAVYETLREDKKRAETQKLRLKEGIAELAKSRQIVSESVLSQEQYYIALADKVAQWKAAVLTAERLKKEEIAQRRNVLAQKRVLQQQGYAERCLYAQLVPEVLAHLIQEGQSLPQEKKQAYVQQAFARLERDGNE